MRWLGALLILATLAVAQAVSPVVAELLRHLSQEQVQAIGAQPTLRTAALAVPSDRRDAATASLKRLEPGASFQTLAELTHAYLYLAQPEEADRVSRLAQTARPGVEGLAFRAWAAQQAGDSDAAAKAAREALKLAPGRPDLVAILKLTEGRTRESREPSRPKTTLPPTPSSPKRESPVLADNARRREAERLLAEAVRAKNLGDAARARALVGRAVEFDPDSSELRDLLASLNVPANHNVVAASLGLLRTTATGKEIAEFIEKEKVPVQQVRTMPGSAAAYYDFGSRTIYVGPDFSSEPPVSQAMLIGHEGYHAIQDIRYSMAPVLETEQDSWLRTMAIYEELKENGLPALPAHHIWMRFQPSFAAAMASGDTKDFYDFVQASYESDAALRKDQAVAALPRFVKPAIRALLDTVYFPVFMNAAPARYLRRSISGNLTNGWDKLSNTLQRHEEEKKWFADWLRHWPAR